MQKTTTQWQDCNVPTRGWVLGVTQNHTTPAPGNKMVPATHPKNNHTLLRRGSELALLLAQSLPATQPPENTGLVPAYGPRASP